MSVPEKHFTEQETQRVLIHLAANSGNTNRTARELTKAGLSIDQKTVWRWKNQLHRERYERIQAELLPEIQKQAAEEHMGLARLQMAGAEQLTQELIAEAEQLEPKDKVAALGKMDIGSGIHTEKAQLLSGQPTAIVENDFGKIQKALKERHGINLTLDGTAVEEPEPPALVAGEQQ